MHYTYDDLGQLIKESPGFGGYIYNYTYDNAGNITKIQVSSTNSVLYPATYVKNFEYSDSAWGDLLVAVDNVQITYDDIGNPTSYYNGFAYQWDGRRLVTAERGYLSYYLSYNNEGLRTSKITSYYRNDDTITNYYYSGSLLVKEESPEYTIVYLYDTNGSPVGFKYRTPSYAEDAWDEYFYEKNLQGDIVAIYNASGTKLISYTYDAWGNFTTSYHNGGASTTATNNPYTYRGYYYDSDLELYYLQSRYYDSNTCRFINADGYVSTGQGILGYNMFAYCGNNPVMRVDPNGEGWISFVVLVIVVIIVTATTTSCSSATQNSTREDLTDAPDLDISSSPNSSYNCYGNAIGKEIVTNPSGYDTGDSTRETFEAVKNDLGSDNVRELSSINDPIGDDEFMVAMKCGPWDYHFIRLTENGWYNKSGTTKGLYVDQTIVESDTWFAMWSNNGQYYCDPSIYYDDETIYFAVKVGWDK